MSDWDQMSDPAAVEEQTRVALQAKYPDAAAKLEIYAEILRTRGIEWGLLGPREVGKIWNRHISNSLALTDVIGQGLDVADVGSGAGLPGIPLAIVRPDLRITLLEPLLRRHNFLTLVVDELGLGDRVVAERLRAEDCDDVFDVVTGRAVAALEKLLKWTTPLFYPGGELLVLKGASAEDEIKAASKLLAKSGLVAEVVEIRAAPAVDGTRAIRVHAATRK